jgi:hypothetical protein
MTFDEWLRDGGIVPARAGACSASWLAMLLQSGASIQYLKVSNCRFLSRRAALAARAKTAFRLY